MRKHHILAEKFPELCEEWNYEKNGALTPWMVTAGVNKKVWWKCSRGHEWEAGISNRASGYAGCPYCHGRSAWPGFNDLATLRPDIAAEWDYELNGDLIPQMFTVGSQKKVWWRCSLGHVWEATIASRKCSNSGCPYCKGKQVWPGFNDLATLRPDIAADWDYELNGVILPTQYSAHSNMKAWWICQKGHPSYYMEIAQKASGEGCPKCLRERTVAAWSRKVLYYSPDGELLNTYPSIAAAARAKRVSSSSVRAVCQGRKKANNGYVFRFADELPEKMQHVPVVNEGKLLDALNQVVSVGDEVMFIRNALRRGSKLVRGLVIKITEKCVIIQTGAVKNRCIMLYEGNPGCVGKVIVLHSRPGRNSGDAVDASGYPIMEGDSIVYMELPVSNRYKGFEFGTVKKVDDKLWEVNGTRRTPDKMVVVNWCRLAALSV